MKTILALLVALSATLCAAEEATPANVVHHYLLSIGGDDHAKTIAFFSENSFQRFTEYMAFQSRLRGEPAEHYFRRYYGEDSSAKSILKLGVREQLRLLFANGLATIEKAPIKEVKILNEFKEGDLTYVVTQRTLATDHGNFESVGVTAVEHEGDGWKVVLPTKFEMLARRLEYSYKHFEKWKDLLPED